MGRSAAARRSTTRRRRRGGRLLLHGRRSDGQALGFLVLAPLVRIVGGDLHDVVRRLLGVALVIELDGARHAGVLHLANGARDGLTRGGLAALGDLFERLDRDGRGDVRLRRIGFGVLLELVLVLVAGLFGLRTGRGRRRGRVVSADDRLAADLNEVRRVQTIGAEELRLHALLACLLEERRRLIVDAAEVEQLRVLCLDRRDDGIEVRLLLGALEADDLHALLLEIVLERLRHALAVRRLVVQHVRRLHLQGAGGEFGADRALDVVAATHAIDVRIAAIGDLLVGVGRRDHGEVVFLVDLGRRDGDAGVQMADDDHDRLVGDDVLRVRDADVRLGLIVVRDQLDLEAGFLEIALELLDAELRAELDAFTERGLAAAQRALRRDFDRLALRGGSRPQRQEGDGQRRAERENAAGACRFHKGPSLNVDESGVCAPPIIYSVGVRAVKPLARFG